MPLKLGAAPVSPYPQYPWIHRNAEALTVGDAADVYTP